MGRKVVNPFKEQRIPSWIRYLATGLVGFFVASWCLFGGGTSGRPVVEDTLTQAQPSTTTSQQAQQAQKHLRQQGIQTKDDDDDDALVLAVINNNDEEESADNHGTTTDDDGNAESEKEEFPHLRDLDEYLEWVHGYYSDLRFDEPHAHTLRNHLTKDLLKESLVLGCDYMAANQKEAGNFNYQYDFVKHESDHGDSPVRQAGALWGMTLCFRAMPDKKSYRTAVETSMLFFQDHTIDGPVPGSSMIAYPGFDESPSGVNALYGLALVDYLRTIRDNGMAESNTSASSSGLSEENLHILLARTIRFLEYMQNGDDLHFSEEYSLETQEKSRDYSPYYDGETLLCLTKAARYIDGYEETLVPLIEEAAPVLAKAYTLDAWRNDEHDSSETKGFYQWSSMVFREYYFAEWANYEYFGDLCLVLAHWIIHTHEILDRQLNTGYAFEGILSAYAIARDRGSDNDEEALSDLEYTIHEGLHKLTGWQVGGPLAHTNKFLKKHETPEKIAIGGIMNAKNKAPLRIDTTQHQMHALMMALENLFPEDEGPASEE